MHYEIYKAWLNKQKNNYEFVFDNFLFFQLTIYRYIWQMNQRYVT